MTADDINIPKIGLDTKLTETQSETSVLIPKMGLEEEPIPGGGGGIVPPMEPKLVSNLKMNPENTANPDKKRLGGVVLKVAMGFAVLILVLFAAIGVPAFLTYQKGLTLYKSVKNLEAVAKSQDLSKIKSQIGVTGKDLTSFKSTFLLLSWTKIIPYFGGYVSDAGHAINAAQAGMDAVTTVITTIEPYSDLLGLKGANGQQATPATDGTKTAQDRIDFIVKSLPQLLPQIDVISDKMRTVEAEVAQINAERYPTEFKGIPIRSDIKSAQDLINQASTLLVNGKPVIENAPYLLGMDSPRTYFILFQNDKELRPTGGFMTGYAIMTVDKAKFNPVLSDDIYNLDAKYKPSTPAPDPIIKYIKGPYVLSQNLRLRDMNWSPDFPTSMQLFTNSIAQVGVKNIDGVIAVDTRVLENLLNVIGPIGVSGYGNFSTKIDPQCNCSQVIHELEAYADVEGAIIWDPLTGKILSKPPNSDNRKRIIGPLMNSVLANAMGQPKDKLAPLFSAAFNSVINKDVLFYLIDPKVEQAVSDFGIGGSIKAYSGDYLHINDANLGGRKSNLYSTEDVTQDIKVAGDGSVTKTLTITYKNPQSQDGWLNSVLPTWVRVYVPKGSTLVASTGLEAKTDPYEDLGKTVFAGYFQLRPEGVATVTLEYKLPFKVHSQYKLLIQKQPGANDYLYTINLGRNQQEFKLSSDKEIMMGL